MGGSSPCTSLLGSRTGSLARSRSQRRRARGPVWDARFRTRWPQGPPRGRALLPSHSTLARARRRQLLRALRAAACEDTPPLVEAHAPLQGIGELLQNVPTDGGSPAACVCHCVRKAFLPSPGGLCARLPTVSTTGLPAASCLGFVGRDFQCERTRTLLKNLSRPFDEAVTAVTTVCFDSRGDLAGRIA